MTDTQVRPTATEQTRPDLTDPTKTKTTTIKTYGHSLQQPTSMSCMMRKGTRKRVTGDRRSDATDIQLGRRRVPWQAVEVLHRGSSGAGVYIP